VEWSREKNKIRFQVSFGLRKGIPGGYTAILLDSEPAKPGPTGAAGVQSAIGQVDPITSAAAEVQCRSGGASGPWLTA